MVAVPQERVCAIDLGGRVPPNNTEAEAAVLSAIFADKRALVLVRPIVSPGDFYSDANARIFDVACDLNDRGVPVDLVTVVDELVNRDRLAAIGGRGYIAKLIDATPAVVHVEAHARIVKKKSRLRSLIAECQAIAAEGYVGDFEEDDFIVTAGSRVLSHAGAANTNTVLDLRELVHREEARLAGIERGELHAGGLPTGFSDLDEAMTGMHPGEVTILAGRPGMGKTALAGNIAVRVARRRWNGITWSVFFQSIEAPAQGLARRMAASEAGISAKRLRWGKLGAKEREQHIGAQRMLEELPIRIDESPNVTPASLRARVLQEQLRAREKGQQLGLVIVDYVQRMKPDEPLRSREQEVAKISVAVAETAKQTGVHVLLLAQLSRETAKRQGKDLRPRLSDLRESGQLEQDAHNVIGLHRPEYYVADRDDVADEVKGLAEACLLKQRDGETDVVPLHFTSYSVRFDNQRDPDGEPVPRERGGEPFDDVDAQQRLIE